MLGVATVNMPAAFADCHADRRILARQSPAAAAATPETSGPHCICPARAFCRATTSPGRDRIEPVEGLAPEAALQSAARCFPVRWSMAMATRMPARRASIMSRRTPAARTHVDRTVAISSL